MSEGWISLHRKFLEWEWFNDNNMIKLFIYLLLKANHTKNTWQGIVIDRGQLLTGLNKLNADTNISLQTLRTCLKRLEKTEEINMQVTNKYRIITICKYDSYQDSQQATNKQTNKQLTSNQQATNKQPTTNNNVNNINNDNNENKEEGKNNFLPERQLLKTVYTYFDFKIIDSLTEKNKINWLETINKLHRIDGYSFAEIQKTIIWAREDEFWNKNFLSISGLRKKNNDSTKFFKMYKQMNNEKTIGNNGKPATSDEQLIEVLSKHFDKKG